MNNDSLSGEKTNLELLHFQGIFQLTILYINERTINMLIIYNRIFLLGEIL
jgi:hypothetical protein